MVEKFSNKFIKGVGSVIDIYPEKGYFIKSYLPGESTSDRIARDWVAVGQTIKKVVSTQSNESKK